MIVLITGTPGTGKTAVSKILAERTGYGLIRISDLATDDVTITVEDGTKIVDVEKLTEKITKKIRGDVIVEGHLSHNVKRADIVVVLRTSPPVLQRRLEKKGFGKEKVRENLEAEALDVCLVESIEKHSDVFEVDTTDREQGDVVDDTLRIINGEGGEFRPGKIDWSEMFF